MSTEPSLFDAHFSPSTVSKHTGWPEHVCEGLCVEYGRFLAIKRHLYDPEGNTCVPPPLISDVMRIHRGTEGFDDAVRRVCGFSLSVPGSTEENSDEMQEKYETAKEDYFFLYGTKPPPLIWPRRVSERISHDDLVSHWARRDEYSAPESDGEEKKQSVAKDSSAVEASGTPPSKNRVVSKPVCSAESPVKRKKDFVVPLIDGELEERSDLPTRRVHVYIFSTTMESVTRAIVVMPHGSTGVDLLRKIEPIVPFSMEHARLTWNFTSVHLIKPLEHLKGFTHAPKLSLVELHH